MLYDRETIYDEVGRGKKTSWRHCGMTSTKEKPKRVRSYRFSLSGISPDKKRLSEGLPERGDADGQHD